MKTKYKHLPGLFIFASILAAFLITALWLWPPSKTKVVPLMKGTPLETHIQILEGQDDGKTIFVIAGIHGDETSGWMAAEQLKTITALQTGTLIILSPANAPGSQTESRNVEAYRDLNRSFPGEKDRDQTDRLAASIYQAIAQYQPDLVIDLHEASREEGNRDFLGNSLIFTDLTGMEDLVSQIIMESQSGKLCSQPFDYFVGAPKGSLNREITVGLGIPVITIEASKEDPREQRIKNHLALVRRVMDYYAIQ